MPSAESAVSVTQDPERVIPASILLEGALLFLSYAIRSAASQEVCCVLTPGSTVYGEGALTEIQSVRNRLDAAEAQLRAALSLSPSQPEHRTDPS